MLRPAHQGYLYQDITTACVFVRALIERFDSVIVDHKQVDDDRIDDLEVRASERRIRRQIKSSQNDARTIHVSDFTGATSSLRIDRLVLTHVRDHLGGADEYRLCATWRPPLSEDQLSGVLYQVSAEPTIPDSSSLHFKLNGSLWWPENGPPTVTPLLPFDVIGAEFGRAEFLEFCDRFVIELELPPASLSLNSPGSLEAFLIGALTTSVGIGRYPNSGRVPTDVAALAIGLATLARTREAALSPSDIECELSIRTDFGRVSQSFPLDEATYCDRPRFRHALARDVLNGGSHQLILGSPGAGKSWDITRLAEDLRAEGAVVARHYCYLEPGDEQVERRITTDVFFANLLGELIDAEPSLRGAASSRYAAGLTEFEETLQAAAEIGPPVVVIVDGLDHIARVLGGAQSLSLGETDIVELIASVDVPAGVVFVLASQPGTHLDPLRVQWVGRLVEQSIPVWSSGEIIELANRHGLDSALSRFGIVSGEAADAVHRSLAMRAEGNPLYARYITQGVVSGLDRGSITSPSDWLNAVPVTSGDIAVYYGHLYGTISKQAQIIADVIAVIDFSVTRDDLQQMFPSMVGWIPGALDALAPVLTGVAGQGGFRIFHESFRRFMVDELQRQERSHQAVLEPVVAWLENRGFYRDAKSFRFLLPALRRSNRAGDIFKYVTASFVADSVAQAHPLEPIEKNLALAADVAGKALDWPMLVRCAELQRTAATCFDDGGTMWDEYWPAYIELFGAKDLSQRMLFDGRPVHSRVDGLIACSRIDDAGGVAPWSEYLDMPGRDSEDEYQDPDSDPLQVPGSDRVKLAAVQGRIRLGQTPRVLRRILAYLRDAEDNIQLGFVRSLGARLARMLGHAAVERIALLAVSSRLQRKPLSHMAASMLRLGIADEARRAGDNALSSAAAGRVLVNVDSAELALQCVELGAPVALALRLRADPSAIAIAVGPDDYYLHSASDLRRWVALIRLTALGPAADHAFLARERERITGIGWYRCWLRFVIELAVIEAAVREGKKVSVMPAFRLLTDDMHPFVGKPRACDLYKIHSLIHDSIARGLSLIRDPDEWQPILDIITTVSENTASRLDQEDGGPLSIGSVLDALHHYVSDPVAGPVIRRVIEKEVQRSKETGTYYSTHADYSMRLARVKKASGDEAGALEEWARAAQFLTGYGWRKDITLFDLIECIPALSRASNEIALDALALAQPLTASVIRHTDGRSTKRAPNAWFRSLAQVDTAAALTVLAETIAEDDGVESWPIVEAIRDGIELSASNADPILADALLSTLQFNPDHESESEVAAVARLEPVLRLAEAKPELVNEAITRAAVEIIDRCRRHQGPALTVLRRTAEKLSIPLQVSLIDSTLQQSPRTVEAANKQHDQHFGWSLNSRDPVFPERASFIDLLVGLRKFTPDRMSSDTCDWERVLLPLGYHVCDLLDSGRDDDVLKLLRYFARDIYVAPNGELHPIGELANVLENAGHESAAAYAYTLAYASTRGGGGWLRLGDKRHGVALDRALVLDRQVALRALGEEVAYALNRSVYGAGISRNLIERVSEWGEYQIAEAAWEESFDVISRRLPLGPSIGWFARLTPTTLPSWSVDEALVAVLLGRLSEPRQSRKVRTLGGLHRAIIYCPHAVCRPLQWWLTRNSRCSSVLIVLHLLLLCEPEPYAVSEKLVNELKGYAASDLWGFRILSVRLLERVGVTAPPQWHDVNTPRVRDTNLTEQRARAMRSAEIWNVIDPISELIPEFGDAVLRRVSALVGPPERYQDRFKDEYQLSFGRDGNSKPCTPIFFWQTELFNVALHETLSELYPIIWERGLWHKGLDDEILALVLPDIRLYLGLCGTMTPRPPWPKPSDVQPGTNKLATVPVSDPVYPGWERLAMSELQYLRAPSRDHGPPIEKVRLYAGAVAIPSGAPIPSNAFPLLKGEWENWLIDLLPSQIQRGLRKAGPIAAMTRHSDWLGDPVLLIAPVVLETLVKFVKPAIGEPFVWKDENGKSAVVLRTWGVRNSTALWAEPVEIEGGDLIVRPDVSERLRNELPYPLIELSRIDRTALTEPDEE